MMVACPLSILVMVTPEGRAGVAAEGGRVERGVEREGMIRESGGRKGGNQAGFESGVGAGIVLRESGRNGWRKAVSKS